MPYRAHRQPIKNLSSSKPAHKSQPLALHSILLALEPRMVFDASLVAGAEALAHDPSAETSHNADSSDQGQPASQNEQPALNLDITPASGGWNADPELDFSAGNFTVDEDSQLITDVGGIVLNDADSDHFRITITVDHGSLSLDYVAGVVGNQYTFNADHSEVTFEADKETAQKVLDTLKYRPNMDYNGADSLQISVEDGDNGWAKSDFTQEITINSVPDKPVFVDVGTLPTFTQADEDTSSSLVFNHGTKDAPDWRPLQISDADGATGVYDIELSIKNGDLSATGLGAGAVIGDTTTYRMNGLSLDAINALLANLQFKGAHDFYGKAELTLSITDNDPALASDPLVKTFDIDVLAVNDNPVLNPADAADRAHQLTVAETNDSVSGKSAEGLLALKYFNIDYDGSLPDANGNIPLFDVDNNLDQLMVRVDALPEHGTLWKKIGGSWIKMTVGSTFSLMDVYNNNVKYTHDPAHQVSEGLDPSSTQDHFSYTLVDGAGGSGSAVMYINLQPVNQPPSLVTDGPVVEAYEGQQGIPFSFKVVDPDQALGADYTVHFTQLPDPLYGVFWYSADGGATYQKVTTATEISLEAVQSGFLRFNHSGKENAIGSFSFTLAVSDDGGGEGSAGAQDVECTLSMSILPNNDHPEWDASVKDLWADNQHTVSVDNSRVININNSFLNARDNDSSRDNITYTVTYGGFGDSGKLLYDTGRVDGDGKPIYRIIASGEKVSQSDIDSGKINWWFDGTGDKTANLTFTVRDGSITTTPVPNDADQPLPYPFPGGSASGWEHGAGPHEGAIGTWQETSPGSGVYAWIPTVHTLTLKSTNITPGEVPSNPEVIDPIPNFNSSQNTATVSEGKDVQLTDAMLNAWFTNKAAGNAIIDPGDPSGSPDKLVYRIEEMTQSGQLVISYDGGQTFTVLGLYSSFTQKDINDGKVYYRHGGSESFSDSFKFSLSDGRNEAKNTGDGGTIFTLNFDVTPLNDTPSAGKGADVKVNEHDTPNAKSDTPGGVVTITTANIAIADVDGTGDKRGQGYATPNDLYIIITGLPEHGALFYNGVEIDLTNSLDPANLAAVKAGGGYAGWSADPNMAGVAIISLADIAAGKLTYRHDGTENFFDSFKYLVSDNQNIDQAHAAEQNGGSVNGAEQTVSIAVTPVNDRPELDAPATPLTLEEGGTATITSANIHCVDPDGAPSAIQFIVTEIPKYGELTLNGKVLGVDSVFTQKDIDEGRVKYTHGGSENHGDSFSYKLSDSIYMASNSEASTFIFEITPVNDAPLIKTPDTIYVESIAGGVIIDGIKITDPDYGPNNQRDAGDTGVVNDIMTVDLTLIDPPGGVTLDLSQIDLFFGNGSGGFISPGVRNGDTYTLVGTFAQIQTWLSQVKIQSKTTSGTTYDPNGDIHLDITVHDGVLDAGVWKNANGSGGSDVYSARDLVKVFISPINNPPEIKGGSPTSLTITEDAAAVAVKDGINPIAITDVDVFERGGNSITLKAEHGILLVTPISGPTIEGRGTASLTITGTLDQINAVLASLQYKADANYNGADTISYVFKDNANSGELPNTITSTTYANHGDTFKYDTGRKDASNNVIWGLAVYGAVGITVTPVNDAPIIQAPKEVFINNPLVFGGNDNMGKPTSIVLSDIDITGPGSFKNDTLTVTLSVDNTNGGTLILANGDLVGNVLITGGASNSNTITLTGKLADLNATLAKLGYDQANWDAGTPSRLTITVSDVANMNESNGSNQPGSALIASHEILINCSNINDAPSITLPGSNWAATEDAAAAKIFSGAGAITLTDPDTFDGQVFASISVSHGTLSVTKEELQAALFTFTGDPALQDAFKISADGKTITLKASLDKINAALKQISYKADSNFNGQDTVNVYVNDLGLWGALTGSEQNVPANDLGATGKGLVATGAGTITVGDVNDAPTATSSTKDFWNGNKNTQADFEDTTNATGKTVDELFRSLFNDATDTQKTASNTTGSEANDFAGIVITGNAANASQGAWQYSTDGGGTWTDMPSVTAGNGFYLDTTAQLRFLPKADFNGAPGELTVRLADDSSNPVGTGTSGVDTSLANSGGATRYSAATIALSTFIRPVNDAPVASGNANLTNINEDATNPAGNTVSNLFNGNFTDSKDTSLGSSANTLGGVVLVGNPDQSGKGQWQYSTNNGTSWNPVPTDLSEGSGLFLDTNAKLRFLPAADYNGAPESLVARLADNSATDPTHNNPALPANNTRVDTSGALKGGATRYSDATVEIGTSITAANDAPVVKGGESMPSNTMTEDSGAVTRTVNDLFGGLFDDAKDDQTLKGGSSPNSFSGIAITGVDTTLGAWEYSTNGGASWSSISGVSETTALYLSATTQIKFTPAANANTSGAVAGLTARLVDSSTAATIGLKYNVAGTNSGGATRYSAAPVTWNLNITPVNDAPTIVTGKESVILNHTEDTTTTTSVNSLFGPSFSDATDNNANTFAGVIVTSNAATAAQGVWQYKDGSNWVNFPTDFTSGGLYLSKDTDVRFVPAANFNGTPGALQVHLVETGAQSYTTGDTVDISTNKGGTTQISAGAVTLGGSVAAVNDAPEVTYSGAGKASSAPITVGEDQALSFNGANKIQISDVDVNENSSALMSVTLSVTNGKLSLGSPGLGYGGIPASTITLTGSLAEINTALESLSYKGNQDYNGTDALTITVYDKGNTGSGGQKDGTSTIYIQVDPENDAPTIVTGKTTVTQNHTEDTTTNKTVNDLFGASFSDATDNNANSFAGVIVTSNATTAAQGVWQYKDGSNWVNFPTDFTSGGLYLSKDTDVRFVPAADFNGPVGDLHVHLVESGAQSYATGNTVDISTNKGGATQISAGTVTLTGAVTAVNDAPEVVSGKETVTLPAINEDTANPSGETVGNLFGPSFNDNADSVAGGSSANDLGGILVVGNGSNAAQGHWQYYDGANWVTIGNRAETNALYLEAATKIRFLPAADFNGTAPSLTVRLADDSNPAAGNPAQPANGTTLDVSGKTGGVTRYSTSTVTLGHTVDAINDAPIWNEDIFSDIVGPGGSHFIYNGDMHLDRSNAGNAANFSPAKSVSDLFGTAFNDSRDDVAGGSSANSLQGVWITGISGDPSLGSWQYSTDGGSSWTNISGVSESAALFLGSAAQLRFAANIATNLPIGIPPHTGLSVALADSSATPATGARADISGANRGGTSAISADSIPLWMTIHQMNYAPEISNLAPVTVTERTPAPLAPNVTISDSDLDHASNANKWDGASVTLNRQGGANEDDAFGASGTLGALTEGGNLTVSGTIIGTVAKNSDGQLKITFNSSATNALVTEALRAITYANESHNPPGSVTLDWLVDDGNYEKDGFFPQGDNQPGESSGTILATQTVTITATSEDPIAKDDRAVIDADSQGPLTGTVLANDYDPDGTQVTVDNPGTIQGLYGVLTLNADGSYAYVLNKDNPLVKALQSGERLEDVFSYQIADSNGGAPATADLHIIIEKTLSPFVVVDNGKPENIENTPIFTLPPLPGFALDLTADKPVIREAALLQDALDRSTNSNLLALGQRLQAMEGSLERAKIVLSGHMADQTVYSGFGQKLALPDNLFRHTLPGEQLTYRVTLEDGSPLPEWLHWDKNSLSFYASPDHAIKDPLSIKIVASDRFNNKAVSVFRIHVAEPEKTGQTPDNEQQKQAVLEKDAEQGDQAMSFRKTAAGEKPVDLSVAAGALDITGQIALHGHKGLLYKAQESLRNLMNSSV